MTSTMTTSVARDHIPSNVAGLSNHMCIFVSTRGDGTLFNASSIMEEDVIKICIRLGHTHSERVLQYFTIKLVVLFHTADKLQIMECGVMRALMLHDKAIKARTSPLSATHVRTYMAVVNGDPSGTQCPPSNGEEEPHSSPSDPHPGGRTLQQLQANHRDLADDELQQLMEDLCQEVTLWKLNAPPDTPFNTLRKTCRKWGSWCRWLGGHLSEKGRGGSPRATILTSCPCTTGWRVGAQRTISSSPAPVQPNKDMGHLINTLAMGLQLGTPWINTFSGNTMPGKNRGVVQAVVPWGTVVYKTTTQSLWSKKA